MSSGLRQRVGDLKDLPVAPPAVILTQPKYPHNVGAAVRACSAWGIDQLWYTGDRVSLEGTEGYRLPREERMRGYRDVDLLQFDRPFELLETGTRCSPDTSPRPAPFA